MNQASSPIASALDSPGMSKSAFNNTQMTTIENTGGMRLAITTFAEAERFATLMSISNFVPKHLRGKPADCLAVLLQSMRWEMDPFAVAQKTYFVNDGLAYEAQLVNAIIISRAPLTGRPDIKWSGEGENLTCTVSATFRGETIPKVRTAQFKTITTKNSPLWKQTRSPTADGIFHAQSVGTSILPGCDHGRLHQGGARGHAGRQPSD